MAEYTNNKLKCYAIVKIPNNGKTYFFDIIAFQHSFELNSIPSCTLALPVGRRADNVKVVAEIHKAVNEMRIQAQVEVICEAKHRFASADPTPFGKWPAGEFRVFKGYVIGVGWRRGTQQAQFTMHCLHWSVDLNFSSPLTRSTTPLNPNIFFMPAGFGGGAAGGVFEGNWVGSTIPARFFDDQTILTDFWGASNGTKGLLGFYAALAKDDRFDYTSLSIAANNVGDDPLEFSAPKTNSEALRALNLFEPLTPGGYKFGVPLKLDAGDWGAVAAEAIMRHMGTGGLGSVESQTIWDKFVGQLHSDFMYSIVPLVDKALVVPLTPGLRDPYHREITGNDYESIEIHGAMPRPLRAVVALVHKTSIAGAALTRGSPVNYVTAGGVFDNPEHKDGMIMFKHAPLWLTYVGANRHTIASTPRRQAVRTATAVAAGAASMQPLPTTIIKDAREVWNRYAQALYVAEVLKNRQGVVTGPVRFDIAPGSMVRVEAVEDKFVNKVLGIPNTFYRACVLAVTTSYDAEGMRGSTTLHLAHLRTEAENNSAAYTVSRHPLWQDKWAGCVLIDDPAFSGREDRLVTK